MSASISNYMQSRDLVVKADIFNTAISSATNILATNIISSQADVAFLTIYCVFQGSGTLAIIRTKAGVTTPAEVLNGGNPLAANAPYMFTIAVSKNETINLQYTIVGGTTITKLVVIETIEV